MTGATAAGRMCSAQRPAAVEDPSTLLVREAPTTGVRRVASGECDSSRAPPAMLYPCLSTLHHGRRRAASRTTGGHPPCSPATSEDDEGHPERATLIPLIKGHSVAS